ncbi:hypothetical protein EAE96_001295 [Botrytis aclada]|nr:hypothetical protein EAE96_001295 [Botrytis aclada]
MLFVKRETTVPVPQVYAICSTKKMSKYTKTEEDCHYIVMEFVEGDVLQDIWSSLDLRQKERTSTQLQMHMDQPRGLPSPGYYGIIGKRGVLDYIFWTGNDVSDGLDGPFDTEHDLNQAMCRKAIYCNASADQKADFYKRAFSVALKDHSPVLTHGDFQRKNIIMRKELRLTPRTGSSRMEILMPSSSIGSSAAGIRRTGNMPWLYLHVVPGVMTGIDELIRSWFRSIMNMRGCKCFVWNSGHRIDLVINRSHDRRYSGTVNARR